MKRHSRILALFISTGFLAALLLVSTNRAIGESDLKKYTENFKSTLNQEIDAVNNFITAYKVADFGRESSISSFQAIIDYNRNTFQKFLKFYQAPPPGDAPIELKEAINLAMNGTEMVSAGIITIDNALKTHSNDELQRGQDSLNEGIGLVNRAVTQYNSFVDTHNRRSRESRTTSSDDLGLGSAFKITTRYGTPLLIIYVYLFIAGSILSSSFRSKLKGFIDGKIKLHRFKGTALYGLHLLPLLPYLYILLLFAALLVWDFALFSVLFITNLPRIPVALIIALVVVIGGSFIAILKGFFGSKKRKIFGIPLTKEEQPKIWEVCGKVAREVGTKNVDEIYLSPQPGIGVNLSGGLVSLLIGRTKRILTIGIGSISGLSISQMEAILAHEFGHFSNKDTAWNSLTFTTAAALQNTLSTMPNPWNSGDSGWVQFTSALNPALWVLYAYQRLFAVLTSGFSRMREVFADKAAVALYGYKNFTEGLMNVARNDIIFSSQIAPSIVKMLTEEDKIYKNVFSLMDQMNKSIDAAELSQINDSILKQESPSALDSHPVIRDRIAYARLFDLEQKQKTEEEEFKTLFANWDDVSKNMSDLYTYYLASVTGYKFKESAGT